MTVGFLLMTVKLHECLEKMISITGKGKNIIPKLLLIYNTVN